MIFSASQNQQRKHDVGERIQKIPKQLLHQRSTDENHPKPGAHLSRNAKRIAPHLPRWMDGFIRAKTNERTRLQWKGKVQTGEL
jgi:hypothetical protein